MPAHTSWALAELKTDMTCTKEPHPKAESIARGQANFWNVHIVLRGIVACSRFDMKELFVFFISGNWYSKIIPNVQSPRMTFNLVFHIPHFWPLSNILGEKNLSTEVSFCSFLGLKSFKIIETIEIIPMAPHFSLCACDCVFPHSRAEALTPCSKMGLHLEIRSLERKLN